MPESRKILIFEETAFREVDTFGDQPVLRIAGAAILPNPFVGRFAPDLDALFRLGATVGERLTEAVVGRFSRPIVSYGKGALVGTSGEFEHGAALIHPRLGKPMRAAIGGGKALIPSNVKMASAGAALDLPLGHKDEAWSFDHFDTFTVSVADAPRPDELVLFVAFADGGRLHPRSGSRPLTD